MKPLKGGWLRIAVRAGLAIGMAGQLAVLSDLKAAIGVAASPSGHWIVGAAALSVLADANGRRLSRT